MAYSKQNFSDGSTLFASQLNHMESGIEQNAKDIAAMKGGSGGGNVDLTGYATEEWVSLGYQPKGNYLTSVPTGYATEDFVRRVIAEASGSPARIGTVDLIAARWVGEGSLYSQVVTINGVTENSQVDLTPSVDQLVIFYEKDLTFVTENENGTVTVYAIGQKPTADYTIQVTITEVIV